MLGQCPSLLGRSIWPMARRMGLCPHIRMSCCTSCCLLGITHTQPIVGYISCRARPIGCIDQPKSTEYTATRSSTHAIRACIGRLLHKAFWPVLVGPLAIGQGQKGVSGALFAPIPFIHKPHTAKHIGNVLAGWLRNPLRLRWIEEGGWESQLCFDRWLDLNMVAVMDGSHRSKQQGGERCIGPSSDVVCVVG